MFIVAVRNGRMKGDAIPLEDLVEAIKAKVGEGKRFLVLTAPLERTSKTAKFIGERLRSKPRNVSALTSETYSDGPILMEAIQNEVNDAGGPVDVVIAVTLSEAPAGIIRAFTTHCDEPIAPQEIGYATGMFINLETGATGRLP